MLRARYKTRKPKLRLSMTRYAKRLTTRRVATLTTPGRHADGQNLYLKVTPGNADVSKSWIFFYTLDGRQHEMGIGSAYTITLAEARQKAARARSLLAQD